MRAPNHEQEADTQSQIISEPEHFLVKSVRYARHEKEGKTPSLRVDYMLESDGNLEPMISEWVCVEHVGFARRKAEAWWRVRSELEVPPSVDEALLYERSLAVPKSITAIKEGKFWRIVEAEIEEIPDSSLLEFVEEEEEMPF
jgi:DNA repair protein RadD